MTPRLFILLVFISLRHGISLQLRENSRSGGRRIRSTDRSHQSDLTLRVNLLRGGEIKETEELQISQNARKGNDQKNSSVESSSTQNRDLPLIKAILVDRRVSIPQIIRVLSAFIFTSSLLECLRTSGLPYRDTVLSTLKESGMPLLLYGCEFPEADKIKVTAMDEYFAKKICQSSNNLLPPKYLPSSMALLGLVTSIAMYVGNLILFPKWFVTWDALMNYQRFDIHVQHCDKDTKVIESYLQCNQENDPHDEVDVYYQSRFLNRMGHHSTKRDGELVETGLSIIIELSTKDKEMRKDGKSEEILRLYRSEGDDHPAPFFIATGQKRVYVDVQIKGGIISVISIDGGPNFYQKEHVSTLIERGKSGLSNRAMLEYAQLRFGPYNELSLPIPTISDAFISRVSTPLAVMQLLGRMLTALEENFIPALMNILLILWQHYSNAKKSIVSIKELSNEIKSNVEGLREQLFWTLRPKLGKNITEDLKQWVLIPGEELLPGDVFYLPKSDCLMPVDAMLLEGSCFAKEAAITGESIPQIKLAIEADSSKSNRKDFLSLDSQHRNSILFAGTDVISCSDWEQVLDTKTIPKKVRKSSSFTKCIVLRTGSYSSKGEIVRALSRSSGYTGGISNIQSDRDAMKLIGVLSICAIFACLSLFIPFDGRAMKKTSGFRRFVQCTRIAIASIPSDLPIALNGALYSCSATLRKEADVVCSDPGSLLTGSKIDMVVFDKTGTLTSDTQSLTKVVTLPGQIEDPMAAVVLAGCHSLSSINATSQLLGDPLDIAGLQYSNWTFRGDSKTAVSSGMKGKLWQIKTFPFDPNKRMSSAIILLEQDDGKFSLWRLVKGAVENIRPLFQDNAKSSQNSGYLLDYDELGKSLESEGNRCIALAVQDISNSTLAKDLFPAGLPKISDATSDRGKSNITKIIAKARLHTKNLLPLCEFEDLGPFKFVGFACFKTSVRPSTPRVIREIRRSGTKVCMLTGDSAAAALSVAKETGFCDDRICKRIAVLDLSTDHELIWTILDSGKSKVISHKDFSIESIRTLITKQQSGRYALMITGDGVEALVNSMDNDESPSSYMLKNLDKVTVFARTSPQIKQQVLTVLKLQCEKTVMMCGDGVNDISAMKTADISAALLGGYGQEESWTEGVVDTENERRKSRLRLRKIGRLRDNTDFGTEAQRRIRMKLEAALKQNKDKQLSIRNIIDLAKDEYRRAVELRKGGATAARILQREESLRKAIVSNENDGNLINHDDDEVNSIKPGEASLAAPFTFLRPCIDGTESIIRSGIAAAAFSLSSHRCIALNSFMSCCNLASLYHDGFRYGKHMWNVELAFMMLMDNALMEISCLPRARISNVRPSTSIFHPAVALSIFLQGIIHLFVLNKGVHGANMLQSYQDGEAKKGLLIRLAQLTGATRAVSLGNMENMPTANLLGRTPFKPNHVTNVVFLLSIFQNTMISIMNHCGLPFHGSLLESKTFCLWSSMSILFVIVLALEIQPNVNKVLQLAPMNSRPFLIFILLLFAIDGILVFISDRLCVRFLNNHLWSNLGKDVEYEENSGLAADVEEKLLKSERNSNKSMIQSIVLFSIVLLTKSFMSPTTS